ncbi:MAG: DUF4097 family beta strand repeat-containing protein [Gemmatimonadota bacterium]|jgi:hypothetical protein
MKTAILAWWMLSAAYAAPDTTVELRRGDRVEVARLSGEIVLEAWGRSGMEVAGEPAGLRVSRSGNRVRVVPGDPKSRGLDVRARVRLPAWVEVEIQGNTLDVTASGLRGGITVRNVSGDIRLRDVEGRVDLLSQEGEIEVMGVRGHVSALSRGERVRLRDVNGAVEVESGSDDIILENVVSSSLRAQTLDGDLYFEGPMVAGGTYSFSVHDGDAVLVLPRDVGAEVNVATFDGEFTSDFPVLLQGYYGGGAMRFTLGDGRAEVEVQVFDGEITLREAGR